MILIIVSFTEFKYFSISFIAFEHEGVFKLSTFLIRALNKHCHAQVQYPGLLQIARINKLLFISTVT